jgi:hypothetical protein
MPNNNNNRNTLLVPQAEESVDKLKFEVTEGLGVAKETGINHVNQNNYENFLDNFKNEVADELGLTQDIENRGWREMTSRECGQIGGNMGGKIGGNMVKKMVTLAEEMLIQKYSK